MHEGNGFWFAAVWFWCVTTLALPAGAQDVLFGERTLPSSGTNVPLSIRGEDYPTGWTAPPGVIPYAALIDARRRIIANSWARSAYLSGPADATRYLARDLYEQGSPPGLDVTCPYTYCTSLSAALRDRTEVYAGWDYLAPEDQAHWNELNRTTMAREILSLPPAGGDSMLFPGMHFRFYTGPAPTYPTSLRWGPRAATLTVPTGEATGFTIDTLHVHPSSPAARGYTNPLTLAAYERASIALIGGAGVHDSVTFYVDPAVTRPHIAAWTQSGVGYLYARCGQAPTRNAVSGAVTADASIVVNTAGTVLDLTGGCASYWRVVAVNTGSTNLLMNVRVGASTSAARMYNLVVGTEVVPSANERLYIRRAMREGAWRFYGLSGGTHVVRTFTYNEGTCTGANICFRNRTSCRAVVNLTGGTPSWGLTFCSAFGSTAGFSATSPGPANDAIILAHEFGHLLTANGGSNHLWDEYFQSSDLNPVCDATTYTLRLCEHSLMADTTFWRRLNTYCTARTHDRVGEVFMQESGTLAHTIIGSRSYNSGNSIATSITECANGTLNYGGPSGQVAWIQLANTGAAPLPHPDWNPDNHNYVNFADGTSIFAGRNL
jgi:hypothetical protein